MPFKTKARKALTQSFCTAGLLTGLSFAPAAQASISFQFNFLDGAGTGFNDSATGASRQNALNSAASLFSSMFGSYFSDSGTIVLDATASNDPLSGNLASAGSWLSLAGGAPAGFNLQAVISTKLQTGIDLNGVDADGVVNFNFGQNWQLDANAPVSSSQYDFYGVAFHEFTHALGFASLIQQNGRDLFGNSTAGHWGTYDQFLVDQSGNAVVNASTFDINSSVWNTASIGGTSPAAGMFFNGANAVAANSGQLVGLYSPTTWIDGSSISHLDTDNPDYSGMMMLHAVGTGSAARDYSAIEVGMMLDLGYSAVAVVPEPASLPMMFAGLGVIGYLSRRRTAAGASGAQA
jgi:hypothetical protein